MSLPKIKLPSFFDNKVSTRTYIAKSNKKLNLDIIFNNLPITPYIVRTKKRGRKKKKEEVDPNKHIKAGSIITIIYNIDGKTVLRGVNTKKKEAKSFRNCMTIVIMCNDEGKHINFKVCANGTIQMTGCKTKEHAYNVLDFFWNYIKDYKEKIYEITEEQPYLEFMLVPAMRNIDFNLGFNVNRRALSNIIRNMPEEEYRSMLEPSFGYTGGNIKFELQDDLIFLPTVKFTFKDSEIVKEDKKYSDYLDMLTEKEQKKKLEKKRYNTFLVFHSGKIIMSGIDELFMENTYYKFLEIISNNYHEIVEKLC